MTADDRAAVLAYARRAVETAVRTGAPDPAPPSDGPFAAPASLFVTLRARGGDLRGCIGNLDRGRPLGGALAAMAAAASREDPRFAPVRPEELAGLELEVSLLGPFVRSARPREEIAVGTHGVQLRLGGRSGLLLPQVALEHGLGPEGFLEAACRKAGLAPGAWREAGAEVWLFTAEVLGPVAVL